MSRESLEYDPEKKEFRRSSASIPSSDGYIDSPLDRKPMPMVNPRVPADLGEDKVVVATAPESPDPLNKPKSQRNPRRQKQHMVWMLLGATMAFWVLMMLVIFLRSGPDKEPVKETTTTRRLPFAD